MGRGEALTLLLDTHAMLFWLREPEQLSKAQREALLSAAAAGPLAVSAITLWEIALLVVRGRIAPTDAIDLLERDPRFLVLPLDGRVATESAGLGALRDPADQLITATARVHALRLVTADRRIRGSGLVQVI
jgi:PIN domain nuclease of toxin-antitoxin system